MDIWKSHPKKIGLIFILLICCGAVTAQDEGFWQSYTSTADIREIGFFEDSLQVASIGGWLKIDPVTLGMRKLTNVDGLGTSNLFDIIRDGGGTTWIAGYGRLIRYKNGVFTPYLFFDNDNNLLTLYKIADDGEYLWVGTSSGLALFSKSADGGQIEDFYFRFGHLNPNSAVYDILLNGNQIYLGTSNGLAIADRTNPDLLKSFINWTTFNSDDNSALAGDTVGTIVKDEGNIFLGTSRSVLEMIFNTSDTSFTRLPTKSLDRVNDLSFNLDTLYIFSDSGLYRHFGTTTEEINLASLPSGAKFEDGEVIDGTLWFGLRGNGLYYSDETGVQHFEDGGLPGVEVSALASNAQGLIAGSFTDNDIAYFNDSTWVGARVSSFVQFGVAARSIGIDVDTFGNIWAGTWGNGMMLITPDTVINYDEKNSALKGVSENPLYVVTDAMADGDGYLFISNFRAIDNNPVVVADLNDLTRWTSFGDEDGIGDVFTYSIDYFDGVIALGTQNTGVYYYYCGPDPFDRSDDSVSHFREDNVYLGSNNVNTVRFDNNGELWVGTKFGLSRYDYGIDRFVNVVLPTGFGPAVQALAFDRRNNIWIGTRTGLAFYNRVTGEYKIYDILNSGLPDNNITELTVDYTTGDIWVGTVNGMARLRTYLGTPAVNIEDVTAYPNPYYIVNGDETLSFNFAENATVRIYSTDGTLINQFNINIPWDGTNQSGRKVASGVYLALLTAPDGSVGKTKIFLIRK